MLSSSVLRKTPIARTTRLKSTGRIKPNRKRTAKTKLASSGSLARRKFIATLPCAACYVVGYSQGAHVLGNGGMGKKKGPLTIAPLCGPRPGIRAMYPGCHWLYDNQRWQFYEINPGFHAERAAEQTEQAYQHHLAEKGRCP
jgi:hypothetical protein